MSSQQPLSAEDRDNLVAYLDGELDEETARALEAKLHLDRSARTEAEALLKTWDMLDYLPRPEPSPSFTHRTLDRVSALQPFSTTTRPRPRHRSRRVELTWAAAVLVAALTGFLGAGYFTHGPEPPGDPAEFDQHLARDLRVIDNKRLYEHVDNLDFLRGLADPDLFGDDS